MTLPFGWIEKGNQAQLTWIATYLARKSISGSLPALLMQDLNQYGSHRTAGVLKDYTNNADFRELSGKMRNAWRVDQYRKKYGNPVSLPMSKVTRKKLNTLAKARGQNQENTLIQIITEAMDYQKLVTAQTKEVQIKLREEQKKERHKANQVEQAYKYTVNALLNTLAEEIHGRCCLEVRFSELDNSSIDSNESRQAYLDLVEKRVSELEPVFTELKFWRISIGPSLNERIREKLRLDDSVKNIEADESLDELMKHL